MNIPLCLAILICCFAGCSVHSHSGIHNLLAGMYKLYSIKSLDSTGNWQESGVANGGESYILYDGLGHMAVQITPNGYRNFKWLEEEDALDATKFRQKIDHMPVSELREAVATFASNYVYVANYKIDAATNTITHERLIGTIPSLWGTKVKRQFSFSGDTLTLLNPVVNRRLVWLRQK